MKKTFVFIIILVAFMFSGSAFAVARTGDGIPTIVNVGATYQTVTVNGVCRAIEYLTSAGVVSEIELFNDSAITDYGAVDTVGTYAWAIAQLPITGGTIRVHGGTYVFNTGITVSTINSIKTIGDGKSTVFQQGESLAAGGAMLFWLGSYNAVFDGIYFLGLGSGTEIALHFLGSPYAIVQNCYFSTWDGNNTYGCIDLSSNGYSVIDKSWFNNCGNGSLNPGGWFASAVSISGSDSSTFGIRITNNEFVGGSYGVYGEYPANILIANNHFQQNSGYLANIHILGSYSSTGHLVIVNNIFDNANQYCVELNTRPSEYGTTDNSIISDNNCTAAGPYSFWVGAGNNISITNNINNKPIYFAGTGNTGTGNTGSSGVAVLSSGAATVTVPSLCRAVCTDATAANPISCTVSGTTLTITGMGMDSINWFCF